MADKRCGRPKVNGDPCRNLAVDKYNCCRTHATADESARMNSEFRAAMAREREQRAQYAKRAAKAKEVQRVVVAVEQPGRATAKHLTYGWRPWRVDGSGYELQIGDRVEVAAPYWAPDRSVFPNWSGTVVSLDPDYAGDVVMIRQVLART
jgi:hypothetical protein